jgi:hypothetical protein
MSRREDGLKVSQIPHHWADHTKYQPHQKYVYVLQSLSGMYVCDFGYTSHWDGARKFTNHKDAVDARADFGWHNDPGGVYNAKIVRLTVAVTQAKVFD